MKKQLIIIGIIILLVAIGLSGCTETNTNSLNDEEKKFVGSWASYYKNESGGHGNITFFSNKTGDAEGFITWKVENERLVMWEKDINSQFRFIYTFKYNNTVLILTDAANGIASAWLKYTPK